MKNIVIPLSYFASLFYYYAFCCSTKSSQIFKPFKTKFGMIYIETSQSICIASQWTGYFSIDLKRANEGPVLAAIL